MCICRGAPPCQPCVPQRGDRGAPGGVQATSRAAGQGCRWQWCGRVNRCCCLATLRTLYGATAKSIAHPTHVSASLTLPLQVGTKYFGRQPGEEELEDDLEEAVDASGSDLADAGALEDSSDSGRAALLLLCKLGH